MKPTRRIGLIVQEVDGEYLVYDGDSKVAAALNLPATVVFRACDGTLEVDELVARLADGEPPLSEEAVHLALAELSTAGLIDDAPSESTTSRRQLLIKLGAAAALTIPAVELINAPGVAAVGSGPTPTPEPTPAPTTPGPTPAPTTPGPTPAPTTPAPTTPGPTPAPTTSAPTTPQPTTPQPTTPGPTPAPTTPRPTTPWPTISVIPV
jgi:hypothetical protein